MRPPLPTLGARGGRRLLLASLGFGLLADLLLRATPWGLNIALSVATLAGLAGLVARWQGVRLAGEGRWLVVPVLFFAGALAWRDSPTLTTANTASLALAISLAALTARAGQVRRAGLTQYLLGLAYMAGAALGGLLPVLRWDIGGRRLARLRGAGVAPALGRGVLLALGPILVFGGLFVAADEHFERLVRTLFRLDLHDVPTRTALVLLYAWLAGGLLREMLLVREREDEAIPERARGRLGIVEVGTVLAALDLLFLAFVLVQVRYLFGGLDQALAIGFSQYARRGFFELVWVAGLTLPLLLLSHALLGAASPRTERVYRLLAGVLIGLLFVILASAVLRLRLYVEDTGLSELRVQAAACLAWLAIVQGWFVLTVLRGQRRRFAFGALASAFLTVAVLNAVNPDALIVRTNAAHGHLVLEGPFVGRSFASFSADATPAIVEALPTLDTAHRADIESRLERRWDPSSNGADDWRTFNWSRAQAYAAVDSLASP